MRPSTTARARPMRAQRCAREHDDAERAEAGPRRGTRHRRQPGYGTGSWLTTSNHVHTAWPRPQLTRRGRQQAPRASAAGRVTVGRPGAAPGPPCTRGTTVCAEVVHDRDRGPWPPGPEQVRGVEGDATTSPPRRCGGRAGRRAWARRRTIGGSAPGLEHRGPPRMQDLDDATRETRPTMTATDLELGSFSEDAPVGRRSRARCAGGGPFPASGRRSPTSCPASPARAGCRPASGSSAPSACSGTALAPLVPRRPPQGRARLDRRRCRRRLRLAAERLGPTYIKLGQIISSGEGIFPEELVTRVQAVPRPGAARAVRGRAAGGRGGSGPPARGRVRRASTPSRSPRRRSPRSTAPRCAPARRSW